MVLTGVAALTAVILLIPEIRESKRENAATERRAAALARERRIREVRELQRPRGTVSPNAERTNASTAARTRSRRRLVRDLEAAMAEDARRRPGAGRILRVDCAGLSPSGGRGAPERDLSARGGRFSCIAVTSEIKPGATRGVVVGYPYRALVDFPSGRLAWCRIVGRPGEGGFTRATQVPIPRRCGG